MAGSTRIGSRIEYRYDYRFNTSLQGSIEDSVRLISTLPRYQFLAEFGLTSSISTDRFFRRFLSPFSTPHVTRPEVTRAPEGPGCQVGFAPLVIKRAREGTLGRC